MLAACNYHIEKIPPTSLSRYNSHYFSSLDTSLVAGLSLPHLWARLKSFRPTITLFSQTSSLLILNLLIVVIHGRVLALIKPLTAYCCLHMTLPMPHFIFILSWLLICHYSINSCLKLEYIWSYLYVTLVLLAIQASNKSIWDPLFSDFGTPLCQYEAQFLK